MNEYEYGGPALNVRAGAVDKSSVPMTDRAHDAEPLPSPVRSASLIVIVSPGVTLTPFVVGTNEPDPP